MSFTRWQPLKELDTLRHQMHHLFDELMHKEARELMAEQRQHDEHLQETMHQRIANIGSSSVR